jgi:ATP-dependent helicase/nuclease subunit B
VRDNYLDWLQAWRAQGWETQSEEQSLRRVIDRDADPADEADGDTLRLEGRIDRIDRRGAERYALDYKTGDPQALRLRMRRYAEDTQLLCYALLLGADAPDANASPASVAAGYLVVSERRDPEHTDTATELSWAPDDLREQSAQLLAQMRRDWRALRTGQAMPALGEPPLCDHCEARGLCRRDHRPSPRSASVQSGHTRAESA